MRPAGRPRLPRLNYYIPRTKPEHVRSLMENFDLVKKFVEAKSVYCVPRSLFDTLYISCAELKEKFRGEIKSTGDSNQGFPQRSPPKGSPPNPKETHTERGQQLEWQNGSMVQQLGSAKKNPQKTQKSPWSSRGFFSPSRRYHYSKSHQKRAKMPRSCRNSAKAKS